MPREKTAVFGVVVKVLIALLVLTVAVVLLLPTHYHGPIPPNQGAAVAALRTYLGAQNVFRRSRRYGEREPFQYANPWKGAGFPDLHQVGAPDPGKDPLDIIDSAFAEAGLGGTPRAGYHFCDILGDKDGPYDFTKRFGLCAFPHEYGETGQYTYVVNETGTVYCKNTGGFPVNIFPDVEREGWVSVDSDEPMSDEPENVWNRKGRTTFTEDARDFIDSFGFVGRRIASTETSAIAALRTYLGAQSTFHRKDYYGLGWLIYVNPWNGTGLPDLYEIGGLDSGGQVLNLIDRTFAQAKMGGTRRAGYYFCEMLGNAGQGPYDFSVDCGLCAFPAEYERTGRNTFLIDATGTVYQKDTQGWPVWIYPADPAAEGWIPVGGE